MNFYEHMIIINSVVDVVTDNYIISRCDVIVSSTSLSRVVVIRKPTNYGHSLHDSFLYWLS